MAGAVALAADDSPVLKALQTDRERVMAAGLTAAEADCWAATAEAAGKFFALPKLHPMDDPRSPTPSISSSTSCSPAPPTASTWSWPRGAKK